MDGSGPIDTKKVEKMLEELQAKQAKETEPAPADEPAPPAPPSQPHIPTEPPKERKSGQKLPAEVIQRIRELKIAGATYEDIRNELGVSDNSITKYTRDIPAQRGRGRPPKGRTGQGARSPLTYPQSRMYQRITADVTQEALARFEEIMAVGKPVIDQWAYNAEMRQLPLLDYLEMAVDFMEAYDGRIPRMEREIALLKTALQFFYERAQPNLLKEKEVKWYFGACILAGETPDPAALFAILKRSSGQA